MLSAAQIVLLGAVSVRAPRLPISPWARSGEHTKLACAGNQHALRYEELRERYAHMPASAVRDMLQLALARKRDAGMPGVTSILQPGAVL